LERAAWHRKEDRKGEAKKKEARQLKSQKKKSHLNEEEKNQRTSKDLGKAKSLEKRGLVGRKTRKGRKKTKKQGKRLRGGRLPQGQRSSANKSTQIVTKPNGKPKQTPETNKGGRRATFTNTATNQLVQAAKTFQTKILTTKKRGGISRSPTKKGDEIGATCQRNPKKRGKSEPCREKGDNPGFGTKKRKTTRANSVVSPLITRRGGGDVWVCETLSERKEERPKNRTRRGKYGRNGIEKW